jgi:hypothetical protein
VATANQQHPASLLGRRMRPRGCQGVWKAADTLHQIFTLALNSLR